MPTNPDSDKNELDGRTKLLRFGLLLNEDQQEIVVERIKELCVKNFGKKIIGDRSIPIPTNDMGCCWDLGNCSKRQE